MTDKLTLEEFIEYIKSVTYDDKTKLPKLK